jgi:predicted glycoside hydrolase/deacetylase ChbG (UPF0249 family)
MSKRLALCADDYGLSLPISRGIEQLAAAARLTDVSCIVNTDTWPVVARRIDARHTRLGLHLNLTEGRPMSPALAALWPAFPPLPQLIVLAHARRLPQQALWAEFVAQLAAFEQGARRAPAHVDGHQHVHHLPQLRELLLELLRARPGMKARHTGRVQGPGFAVKRLLIEGTGGRALGRQLEAQQRAQNTRLVGVYDFRVGDYRRHMQRWLAALPAEGALLMCHPGEAGGPDDLDPIAAARVQELAYLASDAFTEDLAAAGVVLARQTAHQTTHQTAHQASRPSAREGPRTVDGKGEQHHR